MLSLIRFRIILVARSNEPSYAFTELGEVTRSLEDRGQGLTYVHELPRTQDRTYNHNKHRHLTWPNVVLTDRYVDGVGVEHSHKAHH